MIHSARTIVSPVAIIVFAWNLFCFEKWGRTNGRHVQKQWSQPAVTVGRPRGSKMKGSSYIIHVFASLKVENNLAKIQIKYILGLKFVQIRM